MNKECLVLNGCSAEPLMSYLKALGVLRLVSKQQIDPQARGFWHNGVFVLETAVDRDGLARFFRGEYTPTPIVVPWSGGDFFGVSEQPHVEKFSKTPTSSAIIEAFLVTDSPRLAGYRSAIKETLVAMRQLGITQKSQIEGASKKKAKAKLLRHLRAVLPDDVVAWIDVAAQLAEGAFTFNALLGSGGGNDGNTHFSDNFMQNLWDCLPDFDGQRARQTEPPDVESVLFGTASRSLRPKRTAALFDSGAVGGPNSGVGFERAALLNPWNFILALEGCICLAGAVVKRQQVSRHAVPAFPFAVRMTATGLGSAVDSEQGQNEIWLPLWHRPLLYRELEFVFESGRSDVGRRPARTGLDFARAVAGLGVDAGIDAFARYAIVRGRVGGENYSTATSAGTFAVRKDKDVGLLEELDPWLIQLNTAVDEDSPARFRSARRRIETGIFHYCKHGGFATDVLRAIGAAEQELARGGYAQKTPPGKTRPRISPIGGLSAGWLRIANDDSPEFSLARSVAFINRGPKGTGRIRRYLEPVEEDRTYWVWTEGGLHVVWSSRDVAANLGAVLARRLMDAEKNGEPLLPLGSPFPAATDHVARFLSGATDDTKLEELLWGLSLVERESEREEPKLLDSGEIPRAYALLKLTLLPGRLEYKSSGDDLAPAGVAVKPEPAIIARLRAGDVQSACDIAARRLRASGFPLIGDLSASGSRRMIDWSATEVQPARLLAALLFPLPDRAVNQLGDLVLR